MVGAVVALLLFASDARGFGEAEVGFLEAARRLLLEELGVNTVFDDDVALVVVAATHANVIVDGGASGEEAERDGFVELDMVAFGDLEGGVLVCKAKIFPFVLIVENSGVRVDGGDEGRATAVRLSEHEMGVEDGFVNGEVAPESARRDAALRGVFGYRWAEHDG